MELHKHTALESGNDGAPQTYCTGNQETMELHRHTALETRKRWRSTDILHWKSVNAGAPQTYCTEIRKRWSSTDILHWKPGNDGAPQTYCTGNQETMELHRHTAL